MHLKRPSSRSDDMRMRSSKQLQNAKIKLLYSRLNKAPGPLVTVAMLTGTYFGHYHAKMTMREINLGCDDIKQDVTMSISILHVFMCPKQRQSYFVAALKSVCHMLSLVSVLVASTEVTATHKVF